MADTLPSQTVPCVPTPPSQTAAPSADAQTTAPKRVTDFFSSSLKGKRTSELGLNTPGKLLNLDNVQHLRDEDVTCEMLVACVTHIRALESELENVQSKRKEPSTSGAPSAAKKARTSDADTNGNATATVVNKKQKDMILKRLGTGTKQALKGVKFFSGYDATSREAKTSDMISKAEFDAVFTGGKLIQPTPENKPGSKVHIKQYTSEEAAVLLGTTLSALKGELWSKGGTPSRGGGGFSFGRGGFSFGGGGGGFAKGKKLGSTPLSVLHLKVQYSAPSQQLSVCVTLFNGGSANQCCSDDDCW
mmetsp:Transcript_7843/g.13528  ORF Transcript_7843/g.13528 Transcript_7843/m.13528 type:complete len:304 (-) Transcript_7843:179-1090(-)|eukprot:CAMPEP_0198198560 /NCGR_PEP_ID=MMETSP1445-20131203/2025_1 /TAXON_ID=36898 /ORGANISM="Pyramimonas sp., Strain CCMP2087" /LENGTH=303 /DNA_ID=CAMNT_0043868159 /DNA_START=188 /DNA_END=1099 /DNA_ORIENTATION=+